jgi:hypothetical protein
MSGLFLLTRKLSILQTGKFGGQKSDPQSKMAISGWTFQTETGKGQWNRAFYFTEKHVGTWWKIHVVF